MKSRKTKQNTVGMPTSKVNIKVLRVVLNSPLISRLQLCLHAIRIPKPEPKTTPRQLRMILKLTIVESKKHIKAHSKNRTPSKNTALGFNSRIP
ncbi:MAG: hypothetical protein QXL57_07665 [Candidatus Bathyarchaeia archaeon]